MKLTASEFKKGQFAIALDKYQKALRYLDQHPVLPDDAPEAQVEAFRAARVPLLTNAALAALKCTPPAPQLAVKLATRALSLPKLTPSEQGKALYRRALGNVALKNEEEAEKDLKKAAEVVPGDAGITKALKDVEVRQKARRDRERQAYSKMFG